MTFSRSPARRFATWALVLAAALTSVAWIASIWYAIFLGIARTGFFGVSAGQLIVHWKPLADSESGTQSGLLVMPIDSPLHWWFRGQVYTGFGGDTAWYVCVPLWSLVLLFVAGAWCLIRLERRRLAQARAGICLGCGYDCRGLVDGRCPECGSLPANHG